MLPVWRVAHTALLGQKSFAYVSRNIEEIAGAVKNGASLIFCILATMRHCKRTSVGSVGDGIGKSILRLIEAALDQLQTAAQKKLLDANIDQRSPICVALIGQVPMGDSLISHLPYEESQSIVDQGWEINDAILS